MPRLVPTATHASRDPFRGGLVGMYALALMERDGPVHGYRISESVAERTEGAWRPGPGAIYPTLRRLASRGLARSRPQGARRMYEITPAGRTLLKRLREQRGPNARHRHDYAMLWAEVIGVQDVGEFLHRRLQRDLAGLERHLRRPSTDRALARTLASALGVELRAAAERFEHASTESTSAGSPD